MSLYIQTGQRVKKNDLWHEFVSGTDLDHDENLGHIKNGIHVKYQTNSWERSQLKLSVRGNVSFLSLKVIFESYPI